MLDRTTPLEPIKISLLDHKIFWYTTKIFVLANLLLNYEPNSKIDQIIEERSLLKHPFYEMWSDGKLTQESLAGYSKEYFQLVKAVPEFMTPIIEKAPNSVITELTENQQEESDHIKPWISFAGELGISEDELISYSGLDKTKKAVSDFLN